MAQAQVRVPGQHDRGALVAVGWHGHAERRPQKCQARKKAAYARITWKERYQAQGFNSTSLKPLPLRSLMESATVSSDTDV